jgi:hypothetical protein
MIFEHFVSKLVVTFQLPHVQMFYEILLKVIMKPLFQFDRCLSLTPQMKVLI